MIIYCVDDVLIGRTPITRPGKKLQMQFPSRISRIDRDQFEYGSLTRYQVKIRGAWRTPELGTYGSAAVRFRVPLTYLAKYGRYCPVVFNTHVPIRNARCSLVANKLHRYSLYREMHRMGM